MRFLAFPCLSFFAAIVSATIFETETGSFTGAVTTASDLAGYTGTGYVAGFANPGDTLTVSLTGLTAGSYDLTVAYSAQFGDKFTTLSVNGGASTEVSFPNITTLTWTTSFMGSFPLTDSINTVEFSNDWGWYYIDSITVVPTPVRPIVVVDVTNGATVEAEDGILSGVTVATSPTGFSGTGFVQGFFSPEDNVTVTLFSETEALYNVIVRYGAVFGGKQTTMVLNGVGGEEVVLTDTSTAPSPVSRLLTYPQLIYLKAQMLTS
jgi:hypothetical protein